MTAAAPTFRGRVHQNLYVPAGTGHVQALISVTATGGAATGLAAPQAAEVIALDTSGSMGPPADNLRSAAKATAIAIDAMRDGVHFAIIAGSHEARMIYPAHQGTEPATTETRAAAKKALAGVVASGGTAMGMWLQLAATIFDQHPDAVRHAILLTDGRNEHEKESELKARIAACQGMFRCDCRGVGGQWQAPQIREISRALLGSFGAIASPAAMAADFRELMSASMEKQIPEVALQLWTPVGARVMLVKQTSPETVDLTDRRVGDDDGQIGRYPTGSWGAEERDFHISIEVPAAGVLQEKLAGRVSFVRMTPDGRAVPLEQAFDRIRPDDRRETHPEALVSAIWTDDPRRDTTPHLAVLASHDQSELEKAVDRAAASYRAGDHSRATARLDDIRELAVKTGRADLVKLVDGVLGLETGTQGVGNDWWNRIHVDSSQLPPSARPRDQTIGTPDPYDPDPEDRG